MKKLTFLFPKIPFPLAWILFHAGLAGALFFIVLGGASLSIDTDLFGVINETAAASQGPAAAEKVLVGRSSRMAWVLAGAENFEDAKNAAARLYRKLSESETGIFESLSLYMDSAADQFAGYLYRYRYTLLDAAARTALEQNGAFAIAEEALVSAYSPFNLTSLDSIDMDPFFLTERSLRQYLSTALLSGGNLSPRDGVLAAQYGETWYVLLRCVLTAGGTAITNDRSGAGRILQLCDVIQEEMPGVDFVCSGSPFHSYESSSRAQHEITLISLVTLAILVAIFFSVFRSGVPVFSSAAAVVLSILAGLGASLLFFRQVHILTFVFGTTLLGICADYSIHYFVQWKGNPAFLSGREIGSALFRSLNMSFVSTIICFAVLFFSPFTILKQFALFSAAGLFSSWVTVLNLYTRFPLPAPKRRALGWKVPEPSAGPKGRPSTRAAFLAVLALLALVFLGVSKNNLRFENNIRALYVPSAALARSEQISSAVLDYGSPGWYFIVSGSTAEQVLEREEQFRFQLDREIAAGQAGNFSCLAVTRFIPSEKIQRQNYEASRRLLPFAEHQFERMGFPRFRDYADAFREDFAAREGVFALPENAPEYFKEILALSWVGEVEGRWYTCIVPVLGDSARSPEAAAWFRSFAENFDYVYFVNRIEDIVEKLDSLSIMMMKLLVLAYIIVAVVVFVCYSGLDILRIIVLPPFSVLVIFAVMAVLNIPIGFFTVVGIILVFGLGLDYMFYIVESGTSLTLTAVILSFATTALSFGALILSTFAPVHLLGLTVFPGLTAAFTGALLLKEQGRGR